MGSNNHDYEINHKGNAGKSVVFFANPNNNSPIWQWFSKPYQQRLFTSYISKSGRTPWTIILKLEAWPESSNQKFKFLNMKLCTCQDPDI